MGHAVSHSERDGPTLGDWWALKKEEHRVGATRAAEAFRAVTQLAWECLLGGQWPREGGTAF